MAASSPDNSLSSSPTSKPLGDHFVDPLAAAFTDEEVAIAGGSVAKESNTQKNKDSICGIDPSLLPQRVHDQEIQEALTLARQTIDVDPQQVIRDCAVLHHKIGPQASIYEVAGEAYIRLQLFSDAETCLLVAQGLGSSEGSILLNLANLAAMRGDQRLALHWLEQLASQNPKHPQLDAVRQTLFPNGAPNTSTNPFQINLDQRAPGRFT